MEHRFGSGMGDAGKQGPPYIRMAPPSSSPSGNPASRGSASPKQDSEVTTLFPADPADAAGRRQNRRRPKAKPRRYSARPLNTAPPARFTPLSAEAPFFRDPWTVRSLRDLFSVYLPEISISAGAVTGSGFLAAGIYRHWVVDAPSFLAPVTYVAALGIVLSSIYIRGKFYPSPVTRARVRSALLASLLLLGLHSGLYFILRAAG